ncbi:MAG: M24 family metallopeptidase [Solirubrobacterales bacterium]
MNVLIYGDTETSPALRHEVPLAIGDPFLYLEADGRRVVVTSALEEARIARAAPDLERLLVDALGWDELLAEGRTRGEIELELCVRAAAALEIRDALVPPEFPLALADGLRRAGVALTPEETLFGERRRRKTAAEIAGIRRACDAALGAIDEAAAMLRQAVVHGQDLMQGDEPLRSETVRARVREVCARAGAPAPADIMVKPMGPSASIGHDPGAGPLPAHVPIEIDLWPQDEQSGCWADMTRTFVRGEISDPIAELHALALAAHERACAAVEPGVTGEELYGLACDVFEAAGHPTQRTKAAGEALREGFYFSLGHGVGLEVHEAPILGRGDTDSLIAGDVIAIEPGTVVAGVGGARVEDLLIVTDDGSERLTGSFPYGLVP